jgi:hypothetical protein
LSSCAEDDENLEDSLPEDPVTLIPIPEDPIILTPTSPTLGFFTSLSTDYDEYYSGYWKGSLCGGNEQAIIGINNDTVELNTNASFMTPMFGNIESEGIITFPPRQVNWDTEIYGDVRPLEISGVINRELKTGYIYFEVVCSRGPLKYTINTITVSLRIGPYQPSPSNELFRIKSEAIELIGSNVQSCTEGTQCKTFNIDTNDDFCNFSANAYSTTITDENKLLELKSEYSRNKWLSTSYISDTSTTYCAFYLNATCEENICVMR